VLHYDNEIKTAENDNDNFSDINLVDTTVNMPFITSGQMIDGGCNV